MHKKHSRFLYVDITSATNTTLFPTVRSTPTIDIEQKTSARRMAGRSRQGLFAICVCADSYNQTVTARATIRVSAPRLYFSRTT